MNGKAQRTSQAHCWSLPSLEGCSTTQSPPACFSNTFAKTLNPICEYQTPSHPGLPALTLLHPDHGGGLNPQP